MRAANVDRSAYLIVAALALACATGDAGRPGDERAALQANRGVRMDAGTSGWGTAGD